MIAYIYGFLWTRRTLFEHGADVRGRLWTSWIEPWVRIPPPPLQPRIRLYDLIRRYLLMCLSVTLTAERGKYRVFCHFCFSFRLMWKFSFLEQEAFPGFS